MALPLTEVSGARPLASVEATRAITPIGDARQESVERLARLEVGKQFQAQIVSRFDDGTFLVRLADTAARLALPGGGVAGDRLALTLVRTDPRPTFNLDAQESGTLAETDLAGGKHSAPAGGLQSRSLYGPNGSLPLGGAILSSSAAAEGTGSGIGTDSAGLSTAGKFVDHLLSLAQKDGASTALIGKTPLATAGASAGQLASALHDTLLFSGLFYESHVQQWAEGQRSLSDLLREPQARAGATEKPAASLLPSPTPLGNLPPEVVEARRNLQAYFNVAPLDTTANGSKPIQIDASASQMINLQLNTLEQQRVQWRGELFPGQKMDWEVGREPRRGNEERSGAGSTDEDQSWRSAVKFSLPGLGTVAATIHLNGDRVRIQVRAESDASLVALQKDGAKLISALETTGSTLEGLIIGKKVDGDDEV